jgi:Predicted metal-binding integral membrane protein (DUF2182)
MRPKATSAQGSDGRTCHLGPAAGRLTTETSQEPLGVPGETSDVVVVVQPKLAGEVESSLGWVRPAPLAAGRTAVQRRLPAALAAAGLVPLAVFVWSRGAIAGMATSLLGHLAPGGVLAVAGLYPLSPWKGACLRARRSPLGFVMHHNFDSGGLLADPLARGFPGPADAPSRRGANARLPANVANLARLGLRRPQSPQAVPSP